MYNVGVIGFGYWGPNIVRNFIQNKDCNVKYICDKNQNSLDRAKNLYPTINIISDSEEIFQDNKIDIVCIVTPVKNHFKLAKRALESGKHIFLEKPMVQSIEEADILIELAKNNSLVCAVDHTFLFTGSVEKIKDIIESGEIGDVLYFDSTRINLGLFQHDVNVIWDLAPHDLSILFHITNYKPTAITANGVDHLNSGLVDIAYLTLHYENNMIANFHVNWLSPVKIRRLIIGGSKKMLIYDDMEPSEKIKIYDKGIEIKKPEEIHKLLVNYRSGDIVVPKISSKEALKNEIESFIENIRCGENSFINDMQNGRKIIEVLEASNISIQNKKRVLL